MLKIQFASCVITSVLFAAFTVNDTTVLAADDLTPVDLVNPFIGTGGNTYVCAHNTPGATTPFGLIRLSPDTISAYRKTAANTSGYYFKDPRIIGFSHTRLCGTGAIDGGHFRVMPTGLDTPLTELRRGIAGPLDHDRESASPGYYSIDMPKIKVRAELTATGRVGVHRYHFASDSTPRIVIDIGSALGKGTSQECKVQINRETNTITGSVRTFGSFSGRYGGLKVYFAALLKQPWEQCTTWSGDSITVDSTGARGDDVGVELKFKNPANGQPIELALAISHVSVANARVNLNTELADRSFDEVHQLATDQWNDRLSRIQIDGGDESDQTIFYTALYRSLTMPTIFNDVNKQYTGFDGQVHQADGFDYYTDMSLWDTFRTTHPLFTLITPKRHRDMVVSLVKMAEQGGNLPRWPSGTGYTNSMFGAPAEIAIAEAYLKGIRDFDVDTAYRVMRKAALEPAPKDAAYSGRRGISDYIKYGYCPAETMSGAVAKTLEYASTDAAIGRLASELDHKEDAALFARRAQSYRNLWNPESEYFQPRDIDGNFSTALQPLLLTYLDFRGEVTDDYVEGSALQWRWAVTHDDAGLVSLFSSPEKFARELDAFFAGSKPTVGEIPNGYYWHGNQPDIHSVYLFNAAGRPDLTQKWVRWILKHKHGIGPDGIDGNDDGGTLSAWYVFSSLGFYPIVGTDRYELGSPLWKQAKVRIGDHQLQIIADNYAPDRVYVERVELNGKKLDRTWFTHSEIAGGGTLRFVMSDKPLIQ
jgi:predicted alpha-1,2-mannosidase